MCASSKLKVEEEGRKRDLSLLIIASHFTKGEEGLILFYNDIDEHQKSSFPYKISCF